MVEIKSARQRPLILLVDDALDTLGAWELLLEALGYNVITADTGAQGLDKARAWLPDLVITDYMMPIMDGLALCRHLRTDPALRLIPIILWTAARTTFDDPPFDSLMLKPTLLEQMAANIRLLLREDIFNRKVLR